MVGSPGKNFGSCSDGPTDEAFQLIEKVVQTQHNNLSSKWNPEVEIPVKLGIIRGLAGHGSGGLRELVGN